MSVETLNEANEDSTQASLMELKKELIMQQEAMSLNESLS
jgi:hypothetical protein